MSVMTLVNTIKLIIDCDYNQANHVNLCVAGTVGGARTTTCAAPTCGSATPRAPSTRAYRCTFVLL
jgi:hypothetical protein